jgi:hypothetical protein
MGPGHPDPCHNVFGLARPVSKLTSCLPSEDTEERHAGKSQQGVRVGPLARILPSRLNTGHWQAGPGRSSRASWPSRASPHCSMPGATMVRGARGTDWLVQGASPSRKCGARGPPGRTPPPGNKCRALAASPTLRLVHLGNRCRTVQVVVACRWKGLHSHAGGLRMMPHLQVGGVSNG